MAKKAKEGSGVKHRSALIKDVKSINAEMILLEKEIKALSTNLNALIKGDADGPYWNGSEAMTFFKSARGNLSNDIEDYTSAYNRLNAVGILADMKSKK